MVCASCGAQAREIVYVFLCFSNLCDKKYSICFCSCIGPSQVCLSVMLLPSGSVKAYPFFLGPGNTSTVSYGQSPVDDEL